MGDINSLYTRKGGSQIFTGFVDTFPTYINRYISPNIKANKGSFTHPCIPCNTGYNYYYCNRNGSGLPGPRQITPPSSSLRPPPPRHAPPRIYRERGGRDVLLYKRGSGVREVEGRVFREGVDKYGITGIPCFNKGMTGTKNNNNSNSKNQNKIKHEKDHMKSISSRLFSSCLF